MAELAIVLSMLPFTARLTDETLARDAIRQPSATFGVLRIFEMGRNQTLRGTASRFDVDLVNDWDSCHSLLLQVVGSVFNHAVQEEKLPYHRWSTLFG